MLNLTSKKYKKSLFIFRRDLRLEDNTGLIYALENSDRVIPCFILNPEQLETNPLRSDKCVQFMFESLEDLEVQLKERKGKLHLLYGIPSAIVEECIENLEIDAVIANYDYTPYSIKRDHSIKAVCDKHKVPFHLHHDLLLNPPEDVLNNQGKPYLVFTPYFKQASSFEVPKPIPNPHENYYQHSIPFEVGSSIYKELLPEINDHNAFKGGRSAALLILKSIGYFSRYASLRDFPALNETTQLSAHLKFTNCSIREVYHAIVTLLGKDQELIRQLYWRDFFTMIAYFYPHVYQGAFNRKFDQVRWLDNHEGFQAWCHGMTGFPIVDAGMRQLNQTGFMHNRVRMIVGSFLTKDLHIYWKRGEEYFARSLIDYDPAVNNGNWQWVASTGVDAQPYFRVFNPWRQQRRFDEECIYIKRWIPELSELPPEIIHQWDDESYHSLCPAYPAPILDHTKESKIAVEMFKETLK